MSKKIRILLVDDEAIVCEAIAALLSLESKVTVVGEATSADMAVRKARSLHPDLILLDLRLSDRPGVEVIGTLLQDNPQTRIVIVTAFADDLEVAAAFRAGAVGYVLKTQAVTDLMRVIENAYEGLSSMPPRVAKIMLQTLNPPPPPALTNGDLSQAELSVLTYVACGLQNKEIARRLGISRPTVHAHVSSILSKLRLTNRTQAAIYAIKQGFAPLELVEAHPFNWQHRTVRS